MRSKCPAPTSNMQQPALPTCPSGLIITRDNVASLIDIVIYVSRKRVPFLDTDVKGAVRVSMGHPRKFCESWRKVGEIFIARRDIFFLFPFPFQGGDFEFRWTEGTVWITGLRLRIGDDTVGQSRYAKSVGSTAGSRYGNDRVPRSRRNRFERKRVIFRSFFIFITPIKMCGLSCFSYPSRRVV